MILFFSDFFRGFNFSNNDFQPFDETNSDLPLSENFEDVNSISERLLNEDYITLQIRTNKIIIGYITIDRDEKVGFLAEKHRIENLFYLDIRLDHYFVFYGCDLNTADTLDVELKNLSMEEIFY